MPYQRGSGFVGLQQYLGANQQAGQRMGEQVAGTVEQQAAAARGLVDTASAQFAQQAAAGTPQYTEPSNWADALYRAAYSPGYTGPTGLSEEQVKGAQEQISKASDTAKYGTTDAGVATLLQQQYGQGYTGVGGRSLDAALARRGAGERLDYAAGKGIEGLRSYLGTAQQQAQQRAGQGRQEAEGVRQRYGDYGVAHSPFQPQPYGGDVARRPIQTPGTMPEPPPKSGHRKPGESVLHWMFGFG